MIERKNTYKISLDILLETWFELFNKKTIHKL